MSKYGKSLVTVVLLSILVGFSPLQAEANRPWYAEKLEKLGFFVFDTPTEQADFTVESLSGPLAKRSSFKGKIVLLNFWATWCPPCREEMPSIEALSREMKGKAFSVMAVSLGESRSDVETFIAKNRYTYPVFLDRKNSLAATFAGRGIPTTYLLDKDGKFIAGIIGGIKYDSPGVISILSELAAR